MLRVTGGIELNKTKTTEVFKTLVVYLNKLALARKTGNTFDMFSVHIDIF